MVHGRVNHLLKVFLEDSIYLEIETYTTMTCLGKHDHLSELFNYHFGIYWFQFLA